MRISVRRIQEMIAADFGVEPRFFPGKGKRADISRPRQYAMLLARELTPLSYPVIGKLFGRDHSTVMSGIRSARRRVAADPNLALKLEARALLLASEPNKIVDTKYLGFPPKTSENQALFNSVSTDKQTGELLVSAHGMAA